MAIVIRGIIINIKPLIKPLTVALILVLLLAVIFYRPKLPEINWQLLLGKLAIENPGKEEEVIESEKEEGVEGGMPKEEMLVATPGKVYQKTAQPGEGITHLARRALKTYLEEKGTDFNLTPEHKIYIEDYIKNKTGDRWLMVGETLTFSEELIVEAIQKAQQLSPEQLENLKQYSVLVAEL